MSINILEEDVLSMAQAARRLPKRTNGRPIHVATLYRWADAGVAGVRLEVVVIGGHRYTSAQALARFSERLTACASRGAIASQSIRNSNGGGSDG